MDLALLFFVGLIAVVVWLVLKPVETEGGEKFASRASEQHVPHFLP